MIWFLLCLVGALSFLGVVPLPLLYVIIASGVVLLYTIAAPSKQHSAD